MFDYFSDPVYITSYQDVFIYANPEACRFWGKERDTIEGLPIFVVFPQAKGTILEEKRIECLESGKPLTAEIYFPSPPHEGWIELNYNPTPDGIITRFRSIKEKKKTNQNIDFLYELISLVLKQFQFPVFVVDLRYKIKDCNQAFIDYMNLEAKSSLVGSDVFDLLFKKDMDKAKLIFETVFKKNQSQTFNYLKQKIIVSTILDYFELPIYYLVLIHLPEKLNLSLDSIIPSLSKLVENSPDWIFIKNRSSQYIFVNQSMSRDIGKTVENIIGKDDIELFGTEIHEMIHSQEKKVLNGETIQSEHYNTRDKEKAQINTVRFPFFDSTGYVSGICGISRKLETKNPKPDTLESNNSSHKEKDEFYATLWEQSEIPSAIFNAEGDLIDVNQALLSIFSDQIIKPYNLLTDPSISWESKQKIKNDQAIHSERYFGKDESKLFFMNKTSLVHNEYYWDIFVKPLFHRNNHKKIGYMLKIIDLLDRKRQEDNSKRVYVRFVSGMKEILRQIKESISTFIVVTKDNEKLERSVQIFRKQILNMNSIVNDVTKYQKLEAGYMEYNFIPGSLNGFVQKVIKECEESVIFTKANLKTEFDTTIPDLMLDPIRISQALHNICEKIMSFKPTDDLLIKTFLHQGNVCLLITNELLIHFKDGLPEIPPNPKFEFHFGLEVSRNIFVHHNGLFKYYLDSKRFIYFVSFPVNPSQRYNDGSPNAILEGK